MNISRYCYTYRQAKKHVQALKEILKHGPKQDTILTLDSHFLVTHQISHLILDFDGVLGPHGSTSPLPRVIEWLQELTASWAGQIYILTNKPLSVRAAYFEMKFPAVHFVKSPRKKPYPDGIKLVLEHAKVDSQHVAMVDDRLLTGILAAVAAGVTPVWITKPFMSWRHFFVEGFFWCLRKIERLWVKCK